MSEVLWICSDVTGLKCNYFSRSQAGAGRLRQRLVEPHGAPQNPVPRHIQAQQSHEAPTTPPPGHFFKMLSSLICLLGVAALARRFHMRCAGSH